MTTWVMRVWLPDRPGSLAAVAAAISERGGDVVAIDVVDRGAGTAIDDITIEVEAEGVQAIVTGVSQIGEAAVEEVRRRGGWRLSRAETLLAASAVLDPDCAEPLQHLCSVIGQSAGADWVAVTGTDGAVLASVGCLPDATWLENFAVGVSMGPGSLAVTEGMVFASVAEGGLLVARSIPELSASEAEDARGWAAIAALLRRDPAFHASRRVRAAG